MDDEKITADLIGRYLEATGRVSVEKILYNSTEVAEEVRRIQPDVVFVDIEMPEVSGLELAEVITSSYINIEVVFITAYSEYALEAFRANAIDYLMKPVDVQELERVIDKIMRRRPKNGAGQSLKVKALGSFTAKVGEADKPVKWSTAKCEELFAYMLFRKEAAVVSKWKLMEILWPDRLDQKSEINLRSTIFRINRTFKEYGVKARITSNNNHCCMEIENVTVDAFEMERITAQYLADGFQTMPTLKEFCELYTGDLFDDRGYGWAQWMQEYYLQTFISFGKSLVMLRNQRNYDADVTSQMLSYMVEMDPYNEEMREMAMELLYKLKGKKYLSEYYAEFKHLMESQMGVAPGNHTRDVYKRLMNMN